MSPADSRSDPGRSRPPLVRGSFLRRLPLVGLGAFLVAVLIRAFLIQTIVVQGSSMRPLLLAGDTVLVNRLAYGSGGPQRGDVIAFTIEADRIPDRRGLSRKVIDTVRGLGVGVPPYRKFIKRVVALPGETVEIRNGAVVITPADGPPFVLDEPYVEPDGTSHGPTLVPAGSYFVLGDNRPGSIDSRLGLGFVRRADVIGRVFARVWPPARFGRVKRPELAAVMVPGPSAVLGVLRRRYPRTGEGRAAA